jgi:Base plate wedge protein 53
MAGYFSFFGKINYNFDDAAASSQLVTNILQRSAFLKEVSENTAIAYEYQLQDGDTPEIIAHKLYGDPNRHWVVLLFNKLYNAQYEFPLPSNSLEKYILSKHGLANIGVALSTKYLTRKVVEKTITQYGVIIARTTEKFSVSGYTADYTTGAITATPNVTLGTIYPVAAESYEKTFDDGTTVTQTVYLEALSYYDYEVELNESRRNIKLLDAKYMQTIEQEFKKLMYNG